MPTQSLSNNNELKPCPISPNCISSMENGYCAVEPFRLYDATSIDTEKLANLIKNLDERIVVSYSENHIHAEISSKVFGFVDDLDLIIDKEKQLIHLRSASRSGFYDFGVNRKRIENLRKFLKKSVIIQ